jgi:hypothetical protein
MRIVTKKIATAIPNLKPICSKSERFGCPETIFGTSLSSDERTNKQNSVKSETFSQNDFQIWNCWIASLNQNIQQLTSLENCAFCNQFCVQELYDFYFPITPPSGHHQTRRDITPPESGAAKTVSLTLRSRPFLHVLLCIRCPNLLYMDTIIFVIFLAKLFAPIWQG